jgi:hypothetical protein
MQAPLRVALYLKAAFFVSSIMKILSHPATFRVLLASVACRPETPATGPAAASATQPQGPVAGGTFTQLPASGLFCAAQDDSFLNS